VIQQAC